MLTGVTLSLIAVLLLMAALFESVTQPFAILITLLSLLNTRLARVARHAEDPGGTRSARIGHLPL